MDKPNPAGLDGYEEAELMQKYLDSENEPG